MPKQPLSQKQPSQALKEIESSFGLPPIVSTLAVGIEAADPQKGSQSQTQGQSVQPAESKPANEGELIELTPEQKGETGVRIGMSQHAKWQEEEKERFPTRMELNMYGNQAVPPHLRPF